MANLLREYKDELPVRVSVDRPASEWRVKENILAENLVEISQMICNPELIRPDDLLKQAKRRLVFVRTIGGLKYVVKAFPLDTVGKKLKHKKYAFSEAGNMVQAGRLGIPSPQLFGLGYRKKYALIDWNALLMDYLPYSSMEQMLDDNDDVRVRYELLQRAYPLFNILYKTGCNHIDFKPGSILMDAADVKIIDFQYIAFMREPSLAVMAAQAGHFAWDTSVRNGWLDMERMYMWFGGLLEYMEVSGDDNLWDIFYRTSTERYSIADRMNGKAGQP